MMGRLTALGRAMKVRVADHPPLMICSKNPAHLSLIRLVQEYRADRADHKAKTPLINTLA